MTHELIRHQVTHREENCSMKSASCLVVLLSFAVLFSGCAQKSLPRNDADSAISRRPPAITERSIETPGSRVADPAKSGPQPIARPVLEPAETVRADVADQAPLLPVGYINDRIFEYGRKLERWKELDNQAVVVQLDKEQSDTMVRCFRDLQAVLNGYQQLRDTLLQRNVIVPEVIVPEQVLDLQRQDIDFLEGICGRMLGEAHDEDAGWQQRQEGADLNQVETLIERYSANGEYSEVVQVWLKIPDHQVDRISLKTRILYGNALMFLDQPEQAARIYQQIVDAMSASDEQPTDLLSLRKVLADLYTSYGNYPAARKQYNQIDDDYEAIGSIKQWANLQLSILERSETGSPELNEYSSLLRGYLGYLPRRDGYSIVWQADTFLQTYPYSPVSSNVDAIRGDAQRRADAWFNDYLSRSAELAEDRKFQDAMELLQTIPEDLVGDEHRQQVQARLDELVLAEEVARETHKIEQMQELQRTWNDGMLRAEAEDYAGAIEIFTTLLDSEFGARAAEKIKELSLKAAMIERRKAADLFIRFSKTTDIESKKRLLVESRQVLKDILVKYPEVEIADKVVGNINRVEQEMNVLDPQLLPTIKEQEQRQELLREEEQQSVPVGVDVFDLPLSTPEQQAPAAPPASSEPLPVRTPDQL
jgi:tetratricopeptide (TPR) repeat protein